MPTWQILGCILTFGPLAVFGVALAWLFFFEHGDYPAGWP